MHKDLFASIVMLLATAAVVDAETTVQIDRLAPQAAGPAFKFPRVPSPSNSDAGNIATITLVRGRMDRNGAGVSALQDGKLPETEDQPAENYFLAGNTPGRLLVDFGKPLDIKQINSYSWHRSSRADQRFEVFVPREEIDKPSAMQSAAGAELQPHWKQLAAVDSREEDTANTQIGVSIAGSDGATIATTQFVLIAIEPNNATASFSQTFFSEIDFVDGQSYPASQPASPEELIDDLNIGDKVTIHFDTSEVPSLRGWVQSDLMPACKEWYPRIVEALPSDGYEAPSEFRVVFRKDMRGVAYTSGKDVFCAAPWYQANLDTEAVGSVIHELVHVVQQYHLPRNRRPPSWLVEGIADHIRWYQFEAPENRRRIRWNQANFDDAYFASATFLDYIVKNMDPDAIKQINAACREGRYTEGFWETLYGKSAEQIWADAKHEAENAN